MLLKKNATLTEMHNIENDYLLYPSPSYAENTTVKT